MNTFFMNTCRTILVRGGVNLFILSIVAIGLFSVPQQSFAASLNRTNASTTANSFSVFCHFYYYDGQDTTPKQDTQACQQGSKAFGRLLTRLAGHNASMWPVVSLHALAQKNLINV